MKLRSVLAMALLCVVSVAMGKNNKNAVDTPAEPQLPDYSAYIDTPPPY